MNTENNQQAPQDDGILSFDDAITSRTFLSRLEVIEKRREEYRKMQEMAEEAAAEEEAAQAEHLEQPEQPIPDDQQNPPTI